MARRCLEGRQNRQDCGSSQTMSKMEALRERYARPALQFEIAGAGRYQTRGPHSCFGAVTHQGADEIWPEWQGKKLCPLLQLNLVDLPFLPRLLQDVGFLTLFVHPEHYPEDSPNGTTWLLRTYSSLDGLVPLAAPALDWSVKRQALDVARLVEDYPSFEEVSESLSDQFYDQYSTRDGIKVGGWPRLLQSELPWAPHRGHPAKPEYVLQIDSMVELNWSWGDVGCAYIARGTAAGHKNDWFIDWQCL